MMLYQALAVVMATMELDGQACQEKVLLTKVGQSFQNFEQNKKKKQYVRPPNKKRYTPFQLPDVDPSNKKGRNSQEDRAISNADYDKTKWVYNPDKQEYVLSFGTMKVMTVPKDMYLRLKPFQRDAVKWIASVGPVGGILADDMGMGKTVR